MIAQRTLWKGRTNKVLLNDHEFRVRRELEQLEQEYAERKKKLQRSIKAAQRRKHVQDKLKEISGASSDGETELSKDGICQTKKTPRLTFAEPLVDRHREGKQIVSLPQNISSSSVSSKPMPGDKSVSDRHLDVNDTTYCIKNPVILEPRYADCDESLATADTTEKLCNEDQNYVSRRIFKVARKSPVSETKDVHCIKPLTSIDSSKSEMNTNQNLTVKNSQRSCPLTVPEISSTQESSSSAMSEDSQCSIKRRGRGRKRKSGQQTLLKDSAATVNPSAAEIQCFHGTDMGNGRDDKNVDASNKTLENCRDNRSLDASNNSLENCVLMETNPAGTPEQVLKMSSQPKELPVTGFDGVPDKLLGCLHSEDTWDSQSDLFEPCSQDLFGSLSSSQEGRPFFPIFPGTPLLNSSRDFSLPDEEYGTSKLKKLGAKFRNFNLPDEEYGNSKLRKLSAKSATFNSSQTIQAKSNKGDDTNVCSVETICQDTKSNVNGSSQNNLSDKHVVSGGETEICHGKQPCSEMTSGAIHQRGDKCLGVSPKEVIGTSPKNLVRTSVVENTDTIVSTDVSRTRKRQKNDLLKLVDCIPIGHCKHPNPVRAITAGFVVTSPSSKIPYLVVCTIDQVQVILSRDHQWCLLCQWKSEMNLPAKSVHAFSRRSTIAFAVLGQSDQSCSARIFACDIQGNKLETLGNLCEMTVKTIEESPSIHCLVQSELDLILSTSARDISVLRKFTFNEDYTLIDAHVIFPSVSCHLNSLAVVPTVPSLVLSTSNDTACVWNTNNGSLVTTVKLAVSHPVRSCVAAFEEQGFLFLLVHSSSEVKDTISLVIVNPNSQKSKTAISFKTDQNKRIFSLSVFKDRLLGVHPSGDVTLWDIYSGDVIGLLDKGGVQCLTTVGNSKNMFMITTSSRLNQCCVNIYRDVT